MSRVLVATGATSGIGRAVALRAASAGWSVLLTGRRQALLDQALEECRSAGAPAAKAVAGDIQDPALSRLLAEAAALLPGELALLNNAGMGVFGPLESQPASQWASLLQTNLVGSILATHALLPLMLERGGGRIVNVLSITLKHSMPGCAVYSASKAGLEAFGREIRTEYRKRGIMVSNVYPGAVDTPIWDGDKHTPREKMIPPDSLAETIFTATLAPPPGMAVDELTITPLLGIL